MNSKRALIAVTVTMGVLALSGNSLEAQPQNDGQPPELGFFVTSVGIGDGGNLGGLEGADAHCQALAEAAGAGNRTWRAYLSTQGDAVVNARDRVGTGPWANAEGLVIASSVENLHFDNSNINWEHALDENGNQFASRIDGDPDFSEHDGLTGSQIDGAAFPPGEAGTIIDQNPKAGARIESGTVVDVVIATSGAAPPVPPAVGSSDQGTTLTALKWKLLAVGLGLIVLILVIAVLIPYPTSFQYLVFRTTLALAAACVASALPGFFEFKRELPQAGIAAGGALAVFVLVYMWNPGKITGKNEENSPPTSKP